MEFYQVNSEEDLEEGYYGIPEPKGELEFRLQLSLLKSSTVLEENSQTMLEPQKEVILILVPGTVFDEKGHRIGYGGGFYDRFLTKLENEARQEPEVAICKMAIAYECQIVSSDIIPVEPHDIRVNVIVTEQNNLATAQESSAI